MKRSVSITPFQERAEGLSFKDMHPFLVPFFVVEELMNFGFIDSDGEDDLVRSVFSSHNLDPLMEITPAELLKVFKHLDTETAYILEHTFFKVSDPVLEFFLSSSSSESYPDVIPEEIPSLIYLEDWHRLVYKELYDKENQAYSEMINKLLYSDNVHMFKALFEDGEIDGTLKTNSEESLLHYAARNNSVHILRYLISTGLPIDEQDAYGNTPIFSAAAFGAKDSFDALLENGANLSTTDFQGIRVSEIVLYSENIELIDYFIDKQIKNPLELINIEAFRVMLKYDKVKGIKHLFQRKIFDVNLMFLNGQTLFSISLEEQNTEFSKYLIHSVGFNINFMDRGGYYVHHQVIENDMVSILKELKEMGHDIMSPTSEGVTVLEVATNYNAHKCFDFYIEEGVDYELIIPDLIRIASNTVNMKVIQFLKDRGVNFNLLLGDYVSPYLMVMRQYDSDTVMKMIEDINIEFHNLNEVPLLMDPTFHNDYSVVKHLLEIGANPNIPVKFKHNRFYPVMNAIYHRDVEMIKLFVAHGADLNVRTSSFMTPLAYAYSRKDKKSGMIQYLKEQGAFVHPVQIIFIVLLFLVIIFTTIVLYITFR